MTRRRYSPEFVEQLVREVLEESQPLTHVAQKWEIHPGVLSKWVKVRRQRANPRKPEAEELSSLRNEIQVLKDRTELLRGMLEKLYRSKYS